MILWLASYPRSGNTFARMLFHKVYGINSYSLYNSGLSESQIRGLPMADLVGEEYWNGWNIESLAADQGLYLVKTHEMPGDDDYPAIYLVRDGRDALVSYAHFIFAYERKEEETPEAFHQTLRSLIEQDTSFGGWGGNVSAWIERKAKTIVVRYEDMLQDPIGVACNSLLSAGYPFSEKVKGNIPSFDELRQAHPKFFRKGRIGAWRQEMPEETQKFFWEKHGMIMKRLGYSR